MSEPDGFAEMIRTAPCFCRGRQLHQHDPRGCPARKGVPLEPGRMKEFGRIRGRAAAYERAIKFRKES